jgi:hypothetical protein
MLEFPYDFALIIHRMLGNSKEGEVCDLEVGGGDGVKGMEDGGGGVEWGSAVRRG